MSSGPQDSKPSEVDPQSDPEALEYEVRLRLLTRLAGIHRRDASLDDAGQSLVNIIYEYLRTPVVARWNLGPRQRFTWSSGDQEMCRQMATLDIDPSSSDEPAVEIVDDDRGLLVLDLAVDIEGSAQLVLATRTSTRTLDRQSSFWADLAIAAEGALHSAHRLEQARNERIRLTSVVEQMPMGVAIFDLDGKILNLNLRGQAMVERMSWTQIEPQDHAFELCDASGTPLPRDQWPMLRAVQRGELVDEEEFILKFEDHQRHVNMSVLPIVNEERKVTSYLAMARDVTHRSQIAQRKDEFLSVASHELRSPLTPLSGLVRMARKQAEASKTVEPELLIRAEQQVARLQRLIDDLLDVSRIESGRFPIERRPINMGRLVRRIVSPWLAGPHRDRISLTLPDHPVIAPVDPDRLDQVVTNIIDNATKHSGDHSPIAIGLEDAEDHLTITIGDKGQGMPQKIIDRVFDRYFAASKKSGTGLGLYISRQLVEAHGGTIEIESTLGESTTVTIRLPMDS